MVYILGLNYAERQEERLKANLVSTGNLNLQKTSKRIVNFSRERQSAITDNRLDFAHIVIAGNSTKYTVYYIYQNFFNNTHTVFTQLLSAICPRAYYVMIFQLSTHAKDCC